MPWDEGLVNSLVYDAPNPREGRVLGYVAAIREALDIALESDSHVFVLGQGVDDPGQLRLHDVLAKVRYDERPAPKVRPSASVRHAAVGGSDDGRVRGRGDERHAAVLHA